MNIIVEPDPVALGQHAARIASRALRDAIEQNGSARLIVATGASQFEVLKSLTLESDIDWERVDGFHLDEYVGLPSSHRASFCRYLKERLVDCVPLRSFHFLDGAIDPGLVCQKASAAIQAAPIDVALIGIGENAHLAFNDPPADFVSREAYHVVSLDEACRRQQVGEGWFSDLESVPTRAISMTVNQILMSKQIVCSVPDQRKALAVQRSVEGPIDRNVPASILQSHANVDLLLDINSAALLSRGR